jgi:hypothetical protein
MITLVDAEKAFDKIQHFLIIKALNKKLEIEGTYLSIKKATYEKSIGNTVLNGENLKAFSLKSGMR